MSPLQAEPRGLAWLLFLNPFLLMATISIFGAATSSIFGAFGPLRKSIGSVTYSTLATARDGKRKQVARQKPTSVANPNTVAQIMQRMKLAPAQRFYDAYEKVVSNGIMSHSWEGVSYGNASRQEFMSRAMKNSAAVYVPKGYNAFAPGEYEVSAGSLPSLPWRNALAEAPDNATPIFSMTDALTAQQVTYLQNLGLQLGDQITVLLALDGDNESWPTGEYRPLVARIIVGVNNTWEGGAAGSEIELYANGIWVDDTRTAGIAVIVSRGQDSSTAKRSNEKMLLLGNYKNLISAEALNAAIASYQSGEAVTSLGSDWYLNNTPLTGQAVAGTVKTLEITAVGDGNLSRQATFLVVERVSNGQVGYAIVTDGGDASSEAVAVLANNQLSRIRFNDQDSESAFVYGENAARGLVNAGGISLGYVNYTPELATQGGFTYQEF